MKTFAPFALLLAAALNVGVAQADAGHYDITLTLTDDTTFRGTFDYDPATQQILNLQGTLDDVLMGNMEVISYQLSFSGDGSGGITAHAYELPTTVIGTNPPLNNNAEVGINFNAADPTRGATNPAQLEYMDCSAMALMGNTCMYYLAWHNPVIPMEGGHGILSEVITRSSRVTRTDCLLNWAERVYPQLFSPVGVAAHIAAPYYYRYYPNTNAYLGVSTANNHVYFLAPDGTLLDIGDVSNWLGTAGC